MRAPVVDSTGPNLPDGRAREERPTPGELWSRALLDRLREDRFSPAAWQRFLAESLRRARANRARRPAAVAQSRRWGAAGAVAALPVGPRAVVHWALWWAMVDWHVGMIETAAGRERPLAAADALTLARLWAAPLVRGRPQPWLVAAGMASDLADGILARRAGPTRLGRDLDSTADTLFLYAALRGVVDRGGLDPRLLQLERARLLVGAAVTARSYFGGSAPAQVQQNRGPAAVLATGGVLLAACGRRRAAEPLVAAAIGYRTLTRLRAGGGRAAGTPGPAGRARTPEPRTPSGGLARAGLDD